MYPGKKKRNGLKAKYRGEGERKRDKIVYTKERLKTATISR